MVKGAFFFCYFLYFSNKPLSSQPSTLWFLLKRQSVLQPAVFVLLLLHMAACAGAYSPPAGACALLNPLLSFRDAAAAATGCGCGSLRRKPSSGSRSPGTGTGTGSRRKSRAFRRWARMVPIPGGDVLLGTNHALVPGDGEAPTRAASLKPFYLDAFEVSVAAFAEFVADSGHTTESELLGDSFVFSGLLGEATLQQVQQAVASAPWWLPVKAASWRRPEGAQSSVLGRADHPVVHVSWHDASRFCRWAGKRLPTEAEWETGCRGGLTGRLFPWGNKDVPRGTHRMNIWQGTFPENNTRADGYLGTAPADAYGAQNAYGLHNMVGNVWEWTADLWRVDSGHSSDRVKKGGSYLCHKSYCYRYRCAARSFNSGDTGASNLGFRCAADHLPDYLS